MGYALLPFVFTIFSLLHFSLSLEKGDYWSPDPILYFPSHEGLSMHLYELEMIWSRTRFRRGNDKGRQIVTAALQSKRHYGHGQWSLCDYFNFHKSIVCEDSMDALRQKATDCNMLASMGNQTWTGVEEDINVESRTTPVKVVKWGSVTCLAGYFPIPNHEKYYMPWEFSSKSMRLFEYAKKAILPGSDDYTVVHWRRGDQLTDMHRCAGKKDGGPDSSVNCKSAKQLMYDVKNIRRKFGIADHVRTYIATNEQDPASLLLLERSGYYTFGSIEKNSKKFGTFDKYIIELQLMCEASYLVNFGKSTAIEIMDDCRYEKTAPKRIMILDSNVYKIPTPPANILSYFQSVGIAAP